ncbi:MAG: alkyl sulfatase dimerization domain-containing protein [Polyangiaceae bacterium]
MGAVLDLAERLWQGETSTDDHHPFTPLLALEEVANGVAFVSGFANVTSLRTREGIVIVDTGGLLFAPKIHGMVRSWSKAPLHTAVFTHGHLDHIGGIDLYDAEPRPAGAKPLEVVAHKKVPERFARYRMTRGYNGCINGRQFSTSLEWPDVYREPDRLFDDRLSLDIGGTKLELVHDRGETDDHTWVWLPETKVLATGDLFIWASPNAGNPQKVQRYPLEWAAALRKMDALGPEVLCPGHGVPILGRDRVHAALVDTAELLEGLVRDTLAMMNEGEPLDAILHGVKAPERLLDKPYLRPVYDEPEFVVRNVWRLYGGWYDGNPAHLKPAADAQLAQELADIAGGADVLSERALRAADLGDFRLACHLAQFATDAAPNDATIARTRAHILRERAKRETSLMAKGIFRAAADEVDDDFPDDGENGPLSR